MRPCKDVTMHFLIKMSVSLNMVYYFTRIAAHIYRDPLPTFNMHYKCILDGGGALYVCINS
jgi:hypothetical protein